MAAASSASSQTSAAGRPFEREGREQTVAQELQHLAAERVDARHQAVEIGVQHLDHVLAREAIGAGREAAQVGVEDHRPDHLEHAAPDLAVEDPPPGLGADVGVEQVDRDVVAEPRLQGQRQARHQVPERREVGIGETARPLGGPGRDQAGLLLVEPAVDPEPGALGEVVGGAILAEFLEQRELDRLVDVEAHAQIVDPEVDHALEGAGEIAVGRGQLMDVDVGADALIGAPVAAHAAKAGMERLGADVAAPDRHLERHQALTETLDQALEARPEQALLDQPVGDPADLGTIGSRAHGCLACQASLRGPGPSGSLS